MFEFIHFTEITYFFLFWHHTEIAYQCYIFVFGAEKIISIVQMKQKMFVIKRFSLDNPIRIIFISSKINSIGRISKFPGSCLFSITLKSMSSLMKKIIPPPFLFRSNYAVASYRELAIRKTGVKFTFNGEEYIKSIFH